APRPLDVADVVASLRDLNMEQLVINDIQLDESQGRISIAGVPDQPGVAAKLFEQIGEAGIFVDLIIQSHKGRNGQASISFTVPRDQVAAAVEVTNRLAQTYQFTKVTSSPVVAKLTVSGIGLRSHTDVAIRMFRALSELGVNVEMINTSDVRLNVVVAAEQGQRSLAALEAAFADVRV